MIIKDLKELWYSNIEVTIYSDVEDTIFEGSLTDVPEDLDNLDVLGIYDNLTTSDSVLDIEVSDLDD